MSALVLALVLTAFPDDKPSCACAKPVVTPVRCDCGKQEVAPKVCDCKVCACTTEKTCGCCPGKTVIPIVLCRKQTKVKAKTVVKFHCECPAVLAPLPPIPTKVTPVVVVPVPAPSPIFVKPAKPWWWFPAIRKAR